MSDSNIQVCLKCDRKYDSGSGGTYHRIACYCGTCLIGAMRMADAKKAIRDRIAPHIERHRTEGTLETFREEGFVVSDAEFTALVEEIEGRVTCMYTVLPGHLPKRPDLARLYGVILLDENGVPRPTWCDR